jgi:hypothetical protein
MQVGEVTDIECHYRQPSLSCPLELRFVRLAFSADFWRRYGIIPSETQMAGDGGVNILVREKTDLTHGTAARLARRALTISSSSAAKSSSISTMCS